MEAVVRELQSDAQLSVFLSPECDVSAIASAVVAQDSASRDAIGASSRHTSASSATYDKEDDLSKSEHFVKRLDSAVERIDRVISEHIGEHHATLLGQVGSVDELLSHVTLVQSSVGDLKQSVHSLETLMREQHAHLRDTIQSYRNVEQCGDIVRRVLRFQQLSDRALGSELYQENVDAALTKEAVDSRSSPTRDATQHEMVAVALAIREVETMVQDKRFREISVVRAKLSAIRNLGADLKREVRASLRAGIQCLSQADVGDALQILFYLGDLNAAAQASVNDVIQEVERKCTAAISEDKLMHSSGTDAKGLDLSNGSSPGSIVQKSDLWKALEDVFDAIRVHAFQVWNLQRVLQKMVDGASGKRYADLVLEPDEPSLFATFWEVTCAIVRELFAHTRNYTAVVKSLLIAEYPRMRVQATRVLNELYAATKHSADVEFSAYSPDVAADAIGTESGAVERELLPIAGGVAERMQLLDTMGPLHDAFVDRVYRTMANLVQLMFPQSSKFHTSPPGRSDMQTLSRAIFSELEKAGQDPELLAGVLQQVQKVVDLFCSNVKRIMHKGTAATATMSSFRRTPAQAHNVGLMNVLSILDGTVEEVGKRVAAAAVPNGSQAGAITHVSSSAEAVGTGKITPKEAESLCAERVVPCRKMVRDLEYATLGHYLQTIAVPVETIFAKMHDESFGDQSAALEAAVSRDTLQSKSGFPSLQGTGGSKYMQEFSDAFTVILEEHLRRLPVATFTTKCLADFVERLISVFTRHASLLRPLTENGKLRLANDVAQLELHLEHVVPLRSLGVSYEELRAFRHMIFLETSDILRDTTIDKLRPSNVWHHLTSRAPPELQLPHQMKRWTASRYIEWLDTRAAIEQATPCTTPPSSTGNSSAMVIPQSELPLGYPYLKDLRLAVKAEKQAWKEVSKCLDAYSQRVSASATAELSPIYDLLHESNAILLAGYEAVVCRQL
ncbi:unnamed protein product [Hyaloperonospora brassicae]|uniref:Conserved oligomeric Golgi complex subunit 5 n=1 Tax=Hyaloperonospora brassicae TaxID=162125 RepID=A0AAV0UAJ3_HYABA|nr:unnamed protein product [Hyaloperonospora brassicae]